MKKYSLLLGDLLKLEQKLDNLLLYVDFFDNKYDLPAILMKDGAIIVLFELAGIDYEGFSQEEKEQFSYYVRSAVEQLPQDGRGYMLSNMLVRDYARIEKLAANQEANPVIQFVQQKKQEFWEKLAQASFRNQVFCCLRYFDPGKKPPPWRSLISDTARFDFLKSDLDNRVDRLYQGFLTLKSALDRFGFRSLDREKSFNLLYYAVNHSHPPGYRPDLSLNAQLSHSNYCFSGRGSISLNDNLYASVIGQKYPPQGSVAMYLRRFYELDFPLTLKQTFGFADKSKLWKTMDFYKNIAHSLSAVNKTCALYEEEIMDYQNRVESEKELPVHWNFAVVVYADNEDDLKVRVMRVCNLLKEIGSSGIQEKNNFKNAFFSMLPGHERLYLRHSLITTANLGDLFSAYCLDNGDADPVEYFQDRLNGVFSYNPFTARENAHHLAVTGPIGSGKSFVVNKLLLSSLINDPIFYVIDLSRSFTELFGFLQEEMPADTAVMSVSKSHTDFKFNPFLINDLDAPVPDHQFNFCLGLLKLMVGEDGVDSEIEWILSQGLDAFFQKYRVFLRNRSDDKPVPPLTLLANTLNRKVNRSAIANAVLLWTVGRKGEIFNSGRDTLRTAKYCYFDIQDMESDENLMVAVIYSIFSKIYADVADESKRSVQKYLFCDEAHRFLMRPDFAFWTDLFFRTGRHFNLCMGIVTQSVKDLIGDDLSWSKGVIENLKQAFFFNGQKDIDDAFRVFQMSDFHIEQYYRLKPDKRELLYWSSSGLRRILRPVTDNYTYWLATTQPTERHLRDRVKELCGGDVRKTIETCVRVTENCSSLTERIKALEACLPEKRDVAGSLNTEDLNLQISLKKEAP